VYKEMMRAILDLIRLDWFALMHSPIPIFPMSEPHVASP
jgi:hypothetical protein